MARASLARHPESRGEAVRAIEVRIDRDGEHLLLAYHVTGDLARLRIPPPRAPRFVEGLWRHSCCEIFIARPGSAAYHELNFSPSGEWAAYAFSAYREGAPLDDEALNPMIRTRNMADELRLEAVVRCAPGRIRLALSAVMEGEDGALSWWALRHAPGKPDFHHRDAFALELA